MGLERLARYAGRPPLATERLSRLPNGRLLYRLKRRWPDGTSHMIFEPLDFLAKLAALVPPPRFNSVRYHGVLAPSAGWRPLVVPSDLQSTHPMPHSHCGATKSVTDLEPQQITKRRARNYSWAQLMRRVFAVDVLECPDCHSRMRILAAIHPPHAIRKILLCLGLPPRPPPVAPALPDCEMDEMYAS